MSDGAKAFILHVAVIAALFAVQFVAGDLRG